MNAKERFYSGLAKETIGKITSNQGCVSGLGMERPPPS